MKLTKGLIAVFSLLIVILFCQSATAQVVHFKPNTVWGDEIDTKYKLKFDSVRVHCVELNKTWTVVNTDEIDLTAYTSAIEDGVGINGFNIQSAKISNGQLEVRYASSEEGKADFILVNSIGQNVAQIQYNLMSGENMLFIPCSNLSEGVYVLQAQTASGADMYKFVLTSSHSSSVSEMEVLANDDYTYDFTGYCPNRAPSELKGIKPVDNQTINLLFAPSQPYTFIKGKVLYNIKNMDNTYSWLAPPDSGQGTKTEDIVYEAEHIREANLNCDEISGNNYRITLGWLCYPAPSQLGIDVKFTIGDSTLSDMTVDLCRSESKGKYNDYLTQYHYILKCPIVAYKFDGNKLEVDLDATDLQKIGTEFEYSYFEFPQYGGYGNEKANISKDLTGSTWKMVLYLW